MSKKEKTWLIIAFFLLVLGLIMFAAVMTAYNWDFAKLSTVEYETNTYTVNEEFSDILMNTDTADILFVASENDGCKVVCYENKKANHSVVTQGGALVINEVDERKWYDYIGISIGNPKITVYLPNAEYDVLTIKESTGDIEIPEAFSFEDINVSSSTGNVKNYASSSENIKIKTSTGDICVKNISANSLCLSASTGKVTVADVTCEGNIEVKVSTGKTDITNAQCKSIISKGDTGDLVLKNVIAAEKFFIEGTTGDVKFDGCDAAEILVRTDTGDVRGDLLTDKVFITQTDTGNVDVPKTITGGKCEITTDTGDIKITIN